ncbi:hypothetical protein J0X19_20185 [Hymenobacter sp. BT186]|uniref:Uncharacterized protein n=1 Tax=Hymenobacter telluris TaxID=2816474 RepID=A0A939F1B8_9BACT|nr:hypothetical protein [Hymenobacter telluris]MBO0360290.1 hypothetical protein [Hymenobacter telluris]MBW3376317.1 hypothetical protein [Hymenobacter norwichensis]
MLAPTSEMSLVAPITTTPKRRTSPLPTSAVALAALATKAATAWEGSDLPDLLWLSKADFTTLSVTYAQGRDEADAAGDQRTPQAQRLKELDKQVDKALNYVKSYLAEEYDTDEGRAYFSEFGIAREGKSYRLPAARTERVKAVAKLLVALKAHSFDKKKYGTAYWQPLATEYATLVQTSADAAGQRSGMVSAKDQSETQLRKALRALIHHLKANYPDTFEARLREFGFQKESY